MQKLAVRLYLKARAVSTCLTGPTNAILANVTHPSVRATAFALNIFAIHILGDAISPPLLGKIGHHSWNAAFFVVAVVVALSGLLWIWGAKYLHTDTQLAGTRLAQQTPSGFEVVGPSPTSGPQAESTLQNPLPTLPRNTGGGK